MRDDDKWWIAGTEGSRFELYNHSPGEFEETKESCIRGSKLEPDTKCESGALPSS
jgi:hypothetical protein